MKFKIILTLLLSQVLLFANVGNIVAVKGDANIKRNNNLIKATINMKVENGDTVITGSSSKLQVRFKDNTVITVGKNSDFKINDFEYSVNNKKKSKLSVRFGNGLFKSITGAIGKLNPKKFKLTTKSATIGIRGTTVFVEAVPSKPDIIACISGEIVVNPINTNISVVVPEGKITRVSAGTSPTPPRAYKANEVNKFQKKRKVNKQKERKVVATTVSKNNSKKTTETKTQENTLKLEEQETVILEEQEVIEVEEQDLNIDTIIEEVTKVEEVANEVVEEVIDREEPSINPFSNIPELPVLD